MILLHQPAKRRYVRNTRNLQKTWRDDPVLKFSQRHRIHLRRAFDRDPIHLSDRCRKRRKSGSFPVRKRNVSELLKHRLAG